MANTALAVALREEFETMWEHAGSPLGLTVYRSHISDTIVIGNTMDDGTWQAIVLPESEAHDLRAQLDELL